MALQLRGTCRRLCLRCPLYPQLLKRPGRATSRPFPGFWAGIGATSVTSPSSTLLFLEEAAPDTTNDSYFDPRNDRSTGRHKQGANFAFCDGHVTYFKTNLIKFPNPGGDPRFEL